MKMYRVRLISGFERDVSKAEAINIVSRGLGHIVEIIYDLSNEVSNAIAVNA